MSEMHDPYEDQLAAARYRAERDQARQECERLRARLRDSVPRAAYDRLRERLLGHIRECETALGKRNERIKNMCRHIDSLYKMLRDANDADDAAAWVRKHGGLNAVKNLHDNGELPLCDLCEILGLDRVDTSWMDAFRELEKRLMPDGMEWPRTEAGEPVKLGDQLIDDDEMEGWREVDTVIFQRTEDGYTVEIENDRGVSQLYSPGERVKRPAPKVTDADGVEIRVGEIVYDIDTGSEFTVSGIDGETVYVRWGYDFEKRIGTSLAKDLTHRASVLAADGMPLREGETVWGVDSGTRYTVEKITDGIIPIKCRSEMGSTVSLHPSQLTHERPVSDSWERLEEDAETLRQTIASELGDYDFDDTGKDSIQTRLIDLVRRAKKLAERDA